MKNFSTVRLGDDDSIRENYERSISKNRESSNIE
jgi:hypothetical protein